jgi:hypothetical protein
MTGIFPVSGAGVLMPGSTSGGQITPPPWSSLSLSVFDGSLSSARGFCPVLGAWAHAADTPTAVSASTMAERTMIVFTLE